MMRMALSALCDDSEWGELWRDVMQHRFASAGALHDHAMGNLLIVTLWELLGDPVAGLDWVARLLGARGRVLPMAAVPMDIEATVGVAAWKAAGFQMLENGKPPTLQSNVPLACWYHATLAQQNTSTPTYPPSAV